LTEHILHPPTTKRPPSPWAILLSFLINLLFALILVWVAVKWREDAEKLAQQPQPVEVELVQQPQPQPPQAQPKTPQQQQQEQKQQEQKPEEKKPEEKKPDEKKPEEKKPEEKKPDEKKPPEKQPEKPQPEKPMSKPPPPQLLQAPIKDKSSSDHKDDHNGANGANVALALGAGPILSMRSDQDPAQGPEGSRGPVGEELSQSEQDYVLSQILPFWKVDTHRPEGKGMVLEAIIEINADGTLQSPLGRNDPWNPNGIIAGYAQMARLGYSYKREALEGFLLALRLSQPIRVPPGGKWPKWMKLRFAFDDL
jgi:outer membrane biosynthesis protein TonB